jgi:hypothetical protein
MWRQPNLRDAVAGASIVLASLALLTTAPVNGNFWWSDAPRHALNGAFVRDFLLAHPWRHPLDWATDYYLRYPSLTIFFYPPLFYLIESVVFLAFGVSHIAAQATVTLFVVLLGVATYRLALRVVRPWGALAAALLAIGAPAMAFWARQVMLDVPACAVLMAAAVFFVRYAERLESRDITVGVVLVLASMAIKLTTVFAVPSLFLFLVIDRGRTLLYRREVVRAMVIGAIGLCAGAALTLAFGSANVQSVAGRSGDLPRTSLRAWLFYVRTIEAGLGLILIVPAVIGGWLMTFRPLTPADRRMGALLVAWLAVGYPFFSAIGVREPRHGLVLILPFVVWAVYALQRILGRWLPAASLMLAGGTLGYSVFFLAPPHVDGYAAVAAYVAEHAPPNAVVLFHGTRDGNFVFDMRAGSGRRDMAILRTDKLLVRVVAGERVRGVEEADLSEDEIRRMIHEIGVDVIVYQPGFWEDLREMARLAQVVHGGEFERVAQFTISGSVGATERTIEIYKPRYVVQRVRHTVDLDMPLIGDRFEMSLPAR